MWPNGPLNAWPVACSCWIMQCSQQFLFQYTAVHLGFFVVADGENSVVFLALTGTRLNQTSTWIIHTLTYILYLVHTPKVFRHTGRYILTLNLSLASDGTSLNQTHLINTVPQHSLLSTSHITIELSHFASLNCFGSGDKTTSRVFNSIRGLAHI